MSDDDTQKTLANVDKSKGRWVEAEYPKDPNEVYLEVGGEFEGLYMETKPNELYKDDWVHIFRVKGDPEQKYMYGKSNLNKWFENIKPGTFVKIKRFPDQKIQNQPKPLQKFKVWTWEEE